MSNYDELLSKMTRKTENKADTNDTKERSRERTRKSRRTKSDDDSDNDSDERFASTVERESIDYYKVLGVASDVDAKTIKRAYYKRLRKYQPDKIRDKSDKEAVRKNKEKYKLIQEAYGVLNDEYRRKAYDTGKKFEGSRSKSFKTQKDSFKDFIKLQEQNMTDEDKKLAKLKFDMSKKELNARHGYDEQKEEAIDKQEFNRLMEDAVFQREQEALDIQHDNLFEGRQFSHKEFNRMFEKKKRREAKRNGGKGGIVPVGDDGIMAFNDGMDSNFASVDAYSDLYATGSYGGASDNFASVGAGMIGGENSDSDEISIDSDDIEDTYDTHNKGVSRDAMDDMYQRALAEREMQDDKFEKMELDEYGSAMDDKFGISKNFGFMVGNDKFGHQIGQKGGKRSRRNKERVKAQYEAYKELTEN